MPTYIAILRKNDESDFGVEFPDVPGCFSAGTDLEDTRTMATEALSLHLDGLVEDGEAVPSPRPQSAIEAALETEGRGEDFHSLLPVELPAR